MSVLRDLLLGPFEALARRRRDEADPRSLAFDLEYGTETSRFDWGNYEPTLPSVAAHVLDALDVHLGEDVRNATFIDLGCGKGRVLMLAAQRDWRRVVGIERERSLVRTCRANLRKFEADHPGAAPIEVLEAHADELPLPGDPRVLYLYNPFPRAVLDAVLSQNRSPSVWLAYVNPVDSKLVHARGFALLQASDGDDPAWGIWRWEG
jgi:SAM-dependent methyltransferase